MEPQWQELGEDVVLIDSQKSGSKCYCHLRYRPNEQIISSRK